MYCACGCGNITPIAKRTWKNGRYTAGQHVTYCPGHNGFKGKLRDRAIVNKAIATRLAKNPWPDLSHRGLCECGCGERTLPAPRTNRSQGNYKGVPNRFVVGHHNKREDTRQKWSAQRKGRKLSAETRRKLSAVRKGQVHHEAWNVAVSAGIMASPNRHRMGFRRNEGHPNWKGRRAEDNPWRSAMWARHVKRRDDWTCRLCGERSKRGMHAHHIWSFAKFPEKRYDIDNGVTLCKSCHKRGDVHFTPATLADLFAVVTPRPSESLRPTTQA